jgi:ADP-ribose pyrophosphatase YjhB (NUDIX family)
MVNDVPLYQRDPEAWRALLAEGNAKQPRKRASADALIRDAAGRILLVEPNYKPGWDLPGGMAEANESPTDCVRRELREELGINVSPDVMLCVDWVPPHDPWDDLLAFIFDIGVLADERIQEIRLLDGELKDFEFCSEEIAEHRLRPRVWRRTRAALEAVRTGRPAYLQDGHSISLLVSLSRTAAKY